MIEKNTNDNDNDESEEPNAEEALASLAMIEKNTKRILDDDWNDESDSGRKRTADGGIGEPSVKKPKLDSKPKGEGNEEAAAAMKMKKSLKKLKRSEIEEMIATKCVELLTNKSEVGKLRQQVDSYQETVERWKRRAGALSKLCTDLSTVMRKYITDTKTKGRDKVAPVRITRSVGLQVMTPDQRRLQQQRASANRLSRPAAPSSLGSSTLSPATRAPPSVGGLVPGSVTITPTKASTPITKKPSIDVVDLSDDDTPAPKVHRPAPPLTRQPVPRNPVQQHSIRPRPSFRPQGN